MVHGTYLHYDQACRTHGALSAAIIVVSHSTTSLLSTHALEVPGTTSTTVAIVPTPSILTIETWVHKIPICICCNHTPLNNISHRLLLTICHLNLVCPHSLCGYFKLYGTHTAFHQQKTISINSEKFQKYIQAACRTCGNTIQREQEVPAAPSTDTRWCRITCNHI